MDTWISSAPRSVASIFAADLSQDLLVIRNPPDDDVFLVTLQMSSLRNGTGHPRCSLPNHILNIAAPSAWIADNPHYTRCQIFGDTLSVTFGDLTRAVHVLYNWATGQLKCTLELAGASDDATMPVYSGYAILSDDIIIVGRSRMFDPIPVICVYHLQPTSHIGSNLAVASHLPIRIAQYQLPSINIYPVRFTITSFNTSKSSHISEFGPDTASAMLHIDISMGARFAFDAPTRRDEFFTPAGLFIGHVDRARSLGSDWELQDIPWKNWGPAKTRWVNPRVVEEADEDADVNVDERTQQLVGPEQPWGELTRLAGNREGARMVFPGYIIDFAPKELARGANHTNPFEAHSEAPDSSTHSLSRIVTAPTVLVGGEYDHPVVSYLPYREISLDPPLECEDVMLIGDTILTLSVSSHELLNREFALT